MLIRYLFGYTCQCFFFFFWRRVFHVIIHYSVSPVHYLQDPQIHFFCKNFIKNRSHGTIHTFKNYFAIIFSVFNKISDIQIHLKLSYYIIFSYIIFVGFYWVCLVRCTLVEHYYLFRFPILNNG